MSNSPEGQNDVFISMAQDDLDSDLSDELRARIKGELEPGERLLWAGRNRNERSVVGLGHMIAALIAVGLFLFAFLCFFLFNGPRRNGEGAATVLGLVAGFIGFCVVVGLVGSMVEGFNNRGIDRKTLYALTDRRAIIWMPDSRPRSIAIHSIYRGEVARVHRVESPDRSGDLRFTLTDLRSGASALGFAGIPEVRRVEQIVRNNLISDEKTG